MQDQYQSNSASLFTAMARPAGKYVTHFDVPNNVWNVFQVVGVHEFYVERFATQKLAQDYCDQQNGVK